MSRTTRTLFATLGWVVWKLLALVGVPAARRKLEARGSRHGARRRR